jgi:hypothetical protein
VGPSTWISAGDTLSSSEVSSALRTLSSPEADGFADEVSAGTLDSSPYAIRLHLRDGSRRTLRLSPAADGYRATAEQGDFVVRLADTPWDDLLRGRSAFLPDN